jgi:hypothetical protein
LPPSFLPSPVLLLLPPLSCPLPSRSLPSIIRSTPLDRSMFVGGFMCGCSPSRGARLLPPAQRSCAFTSSTTSSTARLLSADITTADATCTVSAWLTMSVKKAARVASRPEAPLPGPAPLPLARISAAIASNALRRSTASAPSPTIPSTSSRTRSSSAMAVSILPRTSAQESLINLLRHTPTSDSRIVRCLFADSFFFFLLAFISDTSFSTKFC